MVLWAFASEVSMLYHHPPLVVKIKYKDHELELIYDRHFFTHQAGSEFLKPFKKNRCEKFTEAIQKSY